MWRIIIFKDGSNPYICKTEEEFNRMNEKYKLTKIEKIMHSDFYDAEERSEND